MTQINLYGFQRNPPKLPRPEISHPQTKKNSMPKFYNRNVLILKTAKQVCRTTQPAYTCGTTPIFRLFSPKKKTYLNQCAPPPQKKKFLSLLPKKTQEPKLIWIPQKSSYRLRHFNSNFPHPARVILKRQIKNEMTAFKGTMSSYSS